MYSIRGVLASGSRHYVEHVSMKARLGVLGGGTFTYSGLLPREGREPALVGVSQNNCLESILPLLFLCWLLGRHSVAEGNGVSNIVWDGTILYDTI